MPYLLEKSIWSNIFAVPCDVVDKHIKLCGEAALKVLLVLLRKGGNLDLDELCRILGESPATVQDAILYWQQAGVLCESENPQASPQQPAAPPESRVQPEPAPVQMLSPALTYTSLPEPAPEAGRQIKTFSHSRGRLNTKEINQMAKDDESIAYLLQESQTVLGRPLTPVATDCIVSLYSYYGMQPDLVLMLLQYCVTMGKDNMRYVEKVAATWLENGVDSHEKAEREILRAGEVASVEHKIKAAFGIYDRKLVDKELKYVDVWVNEYQFSLDMISLAFERAVEQKGKLSFPYINGILTNWHGKGVKTPLQAHHEMQAKEKQPAAGAGSGKGKNSSYDMQELEDLITYQNLLE